MENKIAWFLLGVGIVVLIAARVDNVEFGVGGTYDNTVKIERDSGELIFSDREYQNVSLSDLVNVRVGESTPGDLLYANGSGNIVRLAIGSDGQLLGVSSGLPAWMSSFGALTLTGLSVDSPTLVVDATNNRVGIGTETPNQALHVRGTSWLNSTTTYIGYSASAPTYKTFQLDCQYSAIYGPYLAIASPLHWGSTIAFGANRSTGSVQYGAKFYNGSGAGTPTYLMFSGGETDVFSSNFDTNLYRSAANTLKTDDNLTVAQDLYVNGGDVKTASGNLTVNPTPSGNATINLGGIGEADVVNFPIGAAIETVDDSGDCANASGWLKVQIAGSTYFMPYYAEAEEAE